MSGMLEYAGSGNAIAWASPDVQRVHDEPLESVLALVGDEMAGERFDPGEVDRIAMRKHFDPCALSRWCSRDSARAGSCGRDR